MKTYLRKLTRMLLYMLVDLDEKPPSGSSCQGMMIKQVNRCVLNVLKNSHSAHMLEILYGIVKEHLKLDVSVKLVQVTIRCITIMLRYNNFNQDSEGKNIDYIMQQNNLIFHSFNLTLDSPFLHAFKLMFSQIFKMYFSL